MESANPFAACPTFESHLRLVIETAGDSSCALHVDFSEDLDCSCPQCRWLIDLYLRDA